ncbi:MAG: hypothetical protein Q4C48_09530 [Lachnospiraceae bacterium]|nr:hypothetical protein [Lachnospiraceae bacterium]
MIEKDTIRLLRECDAGIKMGVSAISEVLDYTHDENLKKSLEGNRREHEALQEEITELLHAYHDEGKEPGAMAKGMSWMKTNIKLTLDDSDKVVADLITDGCDMGTKNLRRYLNQYQAADERSKDFAKRLIELEERLRADMREYL